MATEENFNKQVEEIATRAHKMRALCINSQFHPVTREFIADDAARLASLDAAAQQEPMFESLTTEHRQQIVSGMASAVAEYSNENGKEPSDEILATAHKSMESLLVADKASKGRDAQMMYESVGQSLSTSEGVEVRARMAGIVLPTLLATPTSEAVAYVPAATDEIEIFYCHRVAGTSFGDFKKGQVIDDATVGQYSQMKQRYPFVEAQQPDGTKKEFKFVSKTDLKNTTIEIPFKKGSVSIFYNRQCVATDFDKMNQKLYGDIKTADGTSISVNGTIDYVAGSVTVTTTGALEDGKELHIQFEIDIEAKPELIPTIENDMESRKMRPSQSAIACNETIQAMFKMDREFGIDLKSMQMTQLRNYLANEKAIKHLTDMAFSCYHTGTFNTYCPADADWKLQRELLREKLLNVSQQMLANTKTTGLSGMYLGTQAATYVKALGAPFFTPAANYKQTNRVHYCGLLFGMWRVYEVPVAIPNIGPWDIFGYGRGSNHTEAGYIAADAIPATMYDHPIGANLRSRNTLWELAYGEVQPFNGSEYFFKLTLENIPPVTDKTKATAKVTK
ncbi:hypothetical protein VXS06_14455 [Photobacterium toruni]|uniref:Capsid protein n=1 Tax=Photobacterium toruni TaxID=1935446 RepID=A0ABU6L8T7_9GAMM|nr:hypothetical protein [Photobacterium toruni]